jgi:hypothetical protein
VFYGRKIGAWQQRAVKLILLVFPDTIRSDLILAALIITQ